MLRRSAKGKNILATLTDLSTLDVASQVAIVDAFQLGLGQGGPDVGHLLEPQVEGLEAGVALRVVVLAVFEAVVVELEAGRKNEVDSFVDMKIHRLGIR